MLAVAVNVLRPSRQLFASLRYAQSASSVAEKTLFGMFDLKTPSDFKKLNESVRKRTQVLVDQDGTAFSCAANTIPKLLQIINKKCQKKTVAVLDDLSNDLCCAADLVECVRNLHSNEMFRMAATESARDFAQLVESFNVRKDLYLAVKDSLESDKDSLTDVDRRTVMMFLNDFEESGVHLTSNMKEKFLRLNDEVFVVGAKFTNGADQPVKVSHSHSRIYRTAKYLTGANPMTASRSARRWTYSTYYGYIEEQEKNLKHLIRCRHELAQCTGHPDYAHRVQKHSILGTYDNACDFLNKLVKACQPAAEQELGVLENMLMQCEAKQERICESDIHYLTTLYRERAFGSLQHLSKYFSFDGMLKGFGLLTKKLYGVDLIVSIPSDVEIWPGNVVKVDTFDEENQFMGTIYIDLQVRDAKVLGDCHFTVRCSKKLDDGSFQTPIVVLSLSLTEKQEGTDHIRMSTHQAENFFHEMGHAMHSMLGRTEYQHTAGTRCQTDMAEVPSILMEYFFYNIEVLRLIAKDDCGRSISVEDAAAVITSRFAFTSIEISQQAVHSLFDLQLHGTSASNVISDRVSTTDLYRSIWEFVFPGVEKELLSAWHHRFSHLVPYGAKYYSYLVARAIASLIWNSCFRDDPFCKKNGRALRNLLSKGGSLSSADLLQTALSYPPNSQNLAAALREEAYHTCQRFAVSI